MRTASALFCVLLLLAGGCDRKQSSTASSAEAGDGASGQSPQDEHERLADRSCAYLRQIGVAMAMRALAKGPPPAALADLVKPGELDPTALHCPLPGLHFTFTHQSLAPSGNPGAQGRKVIVYEEADAGGLPSPTVDILFGDGSVHTLQTEHAKEVIHKGEGDSSDLQ